jgi:uncharacterized membrane protein YraQ (UPF0718 family)
MTSQPSSPSHPSKRSPSHRKIDWTSLALLAIALLLAAAAWHKGGPQALLGGLEEGGQTLVSVLPILIAAFVVAGFTQALIPPETIERWLGTQSGWRGILLACLAGALIPGGPYVYYPIAGALLRSGAGLGVLIAFITAKNLWTVTRLPYEFALLGPKLTLTRYALTLIIPPLLGWLCEKLFGRHIATLREKVP